MLAALGMALACLHFGVPLAYYWYLKTRWLYKQWNLKIDHSYRPRISIIVPTYMGATWIVQRLDNIYEQDYPRDKIEVIIVDSNSSDGTAEIAKWWAKSHSDITVKVVVETERRGKLMAILEGLKHVSPDSEVVVFTDDDCLWDKQALKNIVKYFADPSVGSVTGSIKYLNGEGLENVYREYYNILRIAESKLWSTPIANGPLLAIRKKIIDEIGVPNFPGADDSAFASYVAFAGYRAIQVDDAWVYEPLTNRQFARMLRRAIHLINYFTKLKNYAKKHGIYKKTPFDRVWKIECVLHVVNPWLLLTSTLLIVIDSLTLNNIISIALSSLGLAMLFVKKFRMWVKNQVTLILAQLLATSKTRIMWRR